MSDYLEYMESVMGPVPEQDHREYVAVCEQLQEAELLASGLDARASVLIGMLTLRSFGADHEKTLDRLQGVLNNRESALRKVEQLRRERASLCSRIAQAQAKRKGLAQ